MITYIVIIFVFIFCGCNSNVTKTESSAKPDSEIVLLTLLQKYQAVTEALFVEERCSSLSEEDSSNFTVRIKLIEEYSINNGFMSQDQLLEFQELGRGAAAAPKYDNCDEQALGVVKSADKIIDILYLDLIES